MINRFVIKFLRVYQTAISPLLTPSCRFHPSCSEYAIQNFGRYGFLKSLFRVIVRLSKCHPYCEGGHDPVK